MADTDRIAAALRYQQELEEAQRPATMNPNMAAQGVGSRNRFAAALPSESGNWSGEALPMKGRAAFLPFQDTLPGSVMNKRSLALPGIVAGAVNAFTAPGRALSGSDPTFNPEEEAANFAMNVMGGGIGASRAAPAPAGSLGMNVWHGSPHRFPPTAKNPLGEFDPTKIGTGQGAQTYGHGLYLAENPKVAGGAEYRDPQGIFARITGDMNNRQEFAHDMISQGREPAKVWEMMKQKYGQFFDAPTLKADFDKVSSARGSLYKVDLPDEQIAKMLDWDKPLSQQSKEVQKALRENELWNVVPEGRSLGEMVQAMNRSMGPERTSNILRDLGIPGIRYLDQGSRNTAQKFIAQHPQGGQNLFNSQAELDAFVKRNPEFKALPPELTSNFVVFPGGEGQLNILGRE